MPRPPQPLPNAPVHPYINNAVNLQSRGYAENSVNSNHGGNGDYGRPLPLERPVFPGNANLPATGRDSNEEQANPDLQSISTLLKYKRAQLYSIFFFFIYIDLFYFCLYAEARAQKPCGITSSKGPRSCSKLTRSSIHPLISYLKSAEVMGNNSGGGGQTYSGNGGISGGGDARGQTNTNQDFSFKQAHATALHTAVKTAQQIRQSEAQSGTNNVQQAPFSLFAHEQPTGTTFHQAPGNRYTPDPSRFPPHPGQQYLPPPPPSHPYQHSANPGLVNTLCLQWRHLFCLVGGVCAFVLKQQFIYPLPVQASLPLHPMAPGQSGLCDSVIYLSKHRIFLRKLAHLVSF